MGFIIILLATALGPTGYVSQYETVATPAICLFSGKQREQVYFNATSPADRFDAFNFPLIFLSIGFLITTYATKLIGLFPANFASLQMWSNHSLGKLQIAFHYAAKPREDSTSRIWDVWKALVLLSYVLSKAFYEIFNSMLWEVRTSEENQGYFSS